MPVWHEATRDLVTAGKLVILGVTQEQHPERCELFSQWKQFDWPILHDPINVLESSAVPILVGVDEFGVVRTIRPRTTTFHAEFIDASFSKPGPEVAKAGRLGPEYPISLSALRQAAETSRAAGDFRALGDSLTLWGGPDQTHAAITAYRSAVSADPSDARAQFRLGVVLRRRYESASRHDTDFQEAVARWSRALELDSNQYIWRRRIQQYGPRLEKPYPFYDWVVEAEQAIRARGENPVSLPVRPEGAEIASPSREFASAPATVEPDSEGRIQRLEPGRIHHEITVVPPVVAPGQSARVHILLRIAPAATKIHWNNESDPMRLWLDPPPGWKVSEQLLTTVIPAQPVSSEHRRFEFEVQIPKEASEKATVRGYALFHVCDDDGGQCRFVRYDLSVPLDIVKPKSR